MTKDEKIKLALAMQEVDESQFVPNDFGKEDEQEKKNEEKNHVLIL